MPFLGFVVKEKSQKHPRGFIVSGNFATRGGAETLKSLLEKQGKDGSEYFVTEHTRKQKDSPL